jgi:hypothetical protein
MDKRIYCYPAYVQTFRRASPFQQAYPVFSGLNKTLNLYTHTNNNNIRDRHNDELNKFRTVNSLSSSYSAFFFFDLEVDQMKGEVARKK